MLSAASEELNFALLDSLNKLETKKHIFSPKFEKKMERLIRKSRDPFKYTLIQRTASIIIVLILSFVALLTASPTVRASVLGWIKENIDFYTKYSSSSTSVIDTEEREYYLSYLPAGYYELNRYTSTNNTTVNHANDENNELLNFYYSTDLNSIYYYIKTLECTQEDLVINGLPVDYYQANTKGVSNTIIGSNADSSMFFIITAQENKNEMIKIFENIKKCE